MTKQPSDTWPRLPGAALAARDALRSLVLRIDAARAAGATDPNLTAFVRQLAAHHADALKAALKAPDRPRSQNRQNPRSEPLWGVSGAQGGRYLPRVPRRLQAAPEAARERF